MNCDTLLYFKLTHKNDYMTLGRSELMTEADLNYCVEEFLREDDTLKLTGACNEARRSACYSGILLYWFDYTSNWRKTAFNFSDEELYAWLQCAINRALKNRMWSPTYFTNEQYETHDFKRRYSNPHYRKHLQQLNESRRRHNQPESDSLEDHVISYSLRYYLAHELAIHMQDRPEKMQHILRYNQISSLTPVKSVRGEKDLDTTIEDMIPDITPNNNANLFIESVFNKGYSVEGLVLYLLAFDGSISQSALTGTLYRSMKNLSEAQLNTIKASYNNINMKLIKETLDKIKIGTRQNGTAKVKKILDKTRALAIEKDIREELR